MSEGHCDGEHEYDIIVCLQKTMRSNIKVPQQLFHPMDLTIKHWSPQPAFPKRTLCVMNDNKAIIVPISAIPEFSLCRNEASSTFNNKVCAFPYPSSPCGPGVKLDFTLVFKSLILSLLGRQPCFNN